MEQLANDNYAPKSWQN